MKQFEILLITDDLPNANGAGMSQTLFKLFEGFPGELKLLAFDKERFQKVPDQLRATIIRVPTGPLHPISNRLGKWVNRFITAWQMQYLSLSTVEAAGLPAPNATLVLVSSSLERKLLLAWLLSQRGYTVIPYFMDDWMANNTLHWKGGNLQQVVKDLLAVAPAWLMISEALKNTLIKRYQLVPKPCLLVHNPSPAVQFATSNLPLSLTLPAQAGVPVGAGFQSSGGQVLPIGGPNTPIYVLQTSDFKLPNSKLNLIYAGSIWPMHADALVATAKAIHLLQVQGHTNYALHIYTSEAHWQQYGSKLAGSGVLHMGWKPYAELPPVLNNGWLLLCTASFADLYSPYSRSSVQTKLTDYMAAGKPVLYIGPADGASGQFVENWDCGFTISTPNPADIAERLLAISRMPEQYQRKANQALLHATTTFSKASVQQNLYAFLEQYAQA